jgi:hypothetical protein
VLVDRRGADPDAIGEPPHRQAVGAFLFEQVEGDTDDLAGARAQLVRAAGCHRDLEPVADRASRVASAERLEAGVLTIGVVVSPAIGAPVSRSHLTKLTMLAIVANIVSSIAPTLWL